MSFPALSIFGTPFDTWKAGFGFAQAKASPACDLKYGSRLSRLRQKKEKKQIYIDEKRLFKAIQTNLGAIL